MSCLLNQTAVKRMGLKEPVVGATIRHDTTEDQLRAAVEYTIRHKGWLVLTYHQIEDNENATFGLDPDSLGAQLEYLGTVPVRIVTMKQVINSLDNNNMPTLLRL